MKVAVLKKMSFLLLLIAAASETAHSACSSPTGAERDLIYNADFHTYQFCNGTKWVAAGGAVSGNQYAPTGSRNVGDTSTGTTTDTGNADYLAFTRISLDQPGTIQSLSLYVATAAGNIRLGVYDASASGGWPGNKKAETNAAAATAGWNTLSVTTPVRLAAGTYWLGFASNNSSLVVKTSTSTTSLLWYTFPYAALPASTSSLSFSSQASSLQYSFYATLSDSGCSNPTGTERKLIYNSDYHTYQFCNGDQWIKMGAGSGGGGAGCSNPAGAERNIIYNTDYNTYQFCNGTNWVKFSGATGIGAQASSAGYFVMTKGTWTGNLGGMTGANAKCLSDLTTNTGWKGYADANSRGLLVAAKVKAFICEAPVGCNNATPLTTYYFANANNSSAGGNSFYSDASGLGPGDNNVWSNIQNFGGTYSYWSNRIYATGTEKYWPNQFWSTSGQCDAGGGAWTSSAGGQQGGYGVTLDNLSGRWYNAGTACNQSFNLVCFVNP